MLQYKIKKKKIWKGRIKNSPQKTCNPREDRREFYQQTFPKVYAIEKIKIDTNEIKREEVDNTKRKRLTY